MRISNWSGSAALVFCWGLAGVGAAKPPELPNNPNDFEKVPTPLVQEFYTPEAPTGEQPREKVQVPMLVAPSPKLLPVVGGALGDALLPLETKEPPLANPLPQPLRIQVGGNKGAIILTGFVEVPQPSELLPWPREVIAPEIPEIRPQVPETKSPLSADIDRLRLRVLHVAAKQYLAAEESGDLDKIGSLRRQLQSILQLTEDVPGERVGR